MSITSAKYVATDGKNTGITAVIADTTWHIPLAEDNSDYQAIQEWVADGNTIEEAD